MATTVERDAQRARAQQARRCGSPLRSESKPLFAEPFKVNNSDERLANILGDYEPNFINQHLNHYAGIDGVPNTPQPKGSSSSSSKPSSTRDGEASIPAGLQGPRFGTSPPLTSSSPAAGAGSRDRIKPLPPPTGSSGGRTDRSSHHKSRERRSGERGERGERGGGSDDRLGSRERSTSAGRHQSRGFDVDGSKFGGKREETRGDARVTPTRDRSKDDRPTKTDSSASSGRHRPTKQSISKLISRPNSQPIALAKKEAPISKETLNGAGPNGAGPNGAGPSPISSYKIPKSKNKSEAPSSSSAPPATDEPQRHPRPLASNPDKQQQEPPQKQEAPRSRSLAEKVPPALQLPSTDPDLKSIILELTTLPPKLTPIKLNQDSPFRDFSAAEAATPAPGAPGNLADDFVISSDSDSDDDEVETPPTAPRPTNDLPLPPQRRLLPETPLNGRADVKKVFSDDCSDPETRRHSSTSSSDASDESDASDAEEQPADGDARADGSTVGHQALPGVEAAASMPSAVQPDVAEPNWCLGVFLQNATGIAPPESAKPLEAPNLKIGRFSARDAASASSLGPKDSPFTPPEVKSRSTDLEIKSLEKPRPGSTSQNSKSRVNIEPSEIKPAKRDRAGKLVDRKAASSGLIKEVDSPPKSLKPTFEEGTEVGVKRRPEGTEKLHSLTDKRGVLPPRVEKKKKLLEEELDDDDDDMTPLFPELDGVAYFKGFPSILIECSLSLLMDEATEMSIGPESRRHKDRAEEDDNDNRTKRPRRSSGSSHSSSSRSSRSSSSSSSSEAESDVKSRLRRSASPSASPSPRLLTPGSSVSPSAAPPSNVSSEPSPLSSNSVTTTSAAAAASLSSAKSRHSPAPGRRGSSKSSGVESGVDRPRPYSNQSETGATCKRRRQDVKSPSQASSKEDGAGDAAILRSKALDSDAVGSQGVVAKVESDAVAPQPSKRAKFSTGVGKSPKNQAPPPPTQDSVSSPKKWSFCNMGSPSGHEVSSSTGGAGEPSCPTLGSAPEAERIKAEPSSLTPNVTSSAQISIPVHPFMQQQRLSADGYLKQAKDLKHSADKVSDPTKRFMNYLDAALAFAQCGYEMEREKNRLQDDISKMYEDTVKLLRIVFSKYKHHEPNDVDKKVYVLNLRIQALLNQKLFKFKKQDASRLSKILSQEQHKSQQLASGRCAGGSPGVGGAAAASPYQASGGGGCALSPAAAGVAVTSSTTDAPVSVTVSPRVQSIMQRYKAVMDIVLLSHELWEQADELGYHLKDFFGQVESKCGQIHLSCTILDLVRYVKASLSLLDHDNPLLNSQS